MLSSKKISNFNHINTSFCIRNMMCLSLAVSFKITEPYIVWLSVLNKMHFIASYFIRHQPQNLLCIILKLLWFCQLSFFCPLNHRLPKLQHTQQLHCSVELNNLSGRNIEEPLKWDKVKTHAIEMTRLQFYHK